VTVTFTPGTWSFAANSVRTPTVTTVTLNDPSYITVNFDNIEAGYKINPESITDLAAEFALSYSGSGTIALSTTEAPIRVGSTNSYKFRVTGNFVSNGSQTATLLFNLGSTWSFTKDDYQPGTATLVNPSASNNQTYIDIAVATSTDLTPATTPITMTNGLDLVDITFDGAGQNGVSISGAPSVLSSGVYRFYIAGQFGKGDVQVKFANGALVDSTGATSRAMQSNFTVQGPVASIQNPSNGASIGILTQNNRGFIDVAFGFPGLDVASFFDLDANGNHPAEFTLSDTGIAIDPKQLPVLLSNSGGIATFRYWVSGTYNTGTLTDADPGPLHDQRCG